MKHLILTMLFVALVATPVFCNVSGCYYGYTQDGDEDPEDDWDDDFCDDSRDNLNCVSADCVGNNAACFKVKYEGDSNFISVYGCVDDINNPSPFPDSMIPFPYTPASLGLSGLELDECSDNDSASLLLLPPGNVEPLGDDVSSTKCACDGDRCNGAQQIHLAAAGLVSVVLLASRRVL